MIGRMPGTNLTRDEAQQRARLLEVASYDVALDLTTSETTFESTTTLRFRCAEAGAETFADLVGATVHEVTTDLDSGPILGQARVPVEPGDTPETLAARVLQREHQLYPLILRRFAAGQRERFDI